LPFYQDFGPPIELAPSVEEDTASADLPLPSSKAVSNEEDPISDKNVAAEISDSQGSTGALEDYCYKWPELSNNDYVASHKEGETIEVDDEDDEQDNDCIDPPPSIMPESDKTNQESKLEVVPL